MQYGGYDVLTTVIHSYEVINSLNWRHLFIGMALSDYNGDIIGGHSVMNLLYV